MPKGIPITEEDIARRRKEIFEAAMHLIVEKGFNETSMREIGQAAGVGKSTLYDYFPSKDDIMLSFVEDEIEILTAAAKEIIAQNISAGEKIRQILHQQLDHKLENKRVYLRLSFETQRLSFETQQKIQTIRHAYQDMLGELVKEGIANGEFRDVNPLLVVRGMFSLLTSAIFTTRPTGSPDQMLSETFDIIFKGLEIRQ